MVCLRASEEALTSECALQLSFNYASHSYTTSWKVEHEEAVQSPFSIYQRQLINWKKLRSKKKSFVSGLLFPSDFITDTLMPFRPLVI